MNIIVVNFATVIVAIVMTAIIISNIIENVMTGITVTMCNKPSRQLCCVQAAQPLEGGRHCVIWPECGLLRAGGEDFVIDAYSQGAIYTMTEAS